MKGMATKKSHSGWWNCHISPRNSKWLSENLQETDRLFNEMLKLIEEDGDSFAKKAQMYYQRRPELVSHVESFYRLYRALAERYDSITSELAKNIPTELQYQGSMNGSEFGTEATSPSVPSSPEQSSEHKPNHLKPHLKTACFEVYLGLRESFDRSRKGSDESSSESGSDYDNGKVLEAFEKSTKLEARIIELEKELNEARDKLLKVMNGSKEHCELLDYFSTTSSLENQPIVANKIFAELMKQNEELQAVLSDRVEEIENLKEAMRAVEKRFDNEISCRENIIKEFKTWIGALLNKFVQEDPSPGAVEFKSGNAEEEKDEEEHMSDQNSSLEIETLNEKAIGAQSFNMLLQENAEERDKDVQTADQNSSLEIETLNEKAIAAQSSDLLLQERSELETEISSLIVSTSSYRSKLQLFEERVKQLETEKSKICTESEKRASELNQSLDEFKMRVDTMTLERDELNAQVVNLIEDIEIWDDESRKIDEQLHVLHAEHAKLIQEVEEARKASDELTNRVNELEDVVESQRTVIVDCAEGKKEAIKQLCISLEHYRIGYQELRQIVQMKFKCLNS